MEVLCPCLASLGEQHLDSDFDAVRIYLYGGKTGTAEHDASVTP